MFVILNTTSVDPELKEFTAAYAVWSRVPVHSAPNGAAFVEVWDIPPSEALVLLNHPEMEEGQVIHEA